MSPRKKARSRAARTRATDAASDGVRPPRKKRNNQPRTASGKRASTALMAIAALDAREGLRERTEAGHRAAGREPPSQESDSRQAGAVVRKVDSDIRTFAIPVT